jgi:hypothetical protein
MFQLVALNFLSYDEFDSPTFNLNYLIRDQ